MKRKSPNVFGLSFLDVISCGFGAVVLFFMIINTASTRQTEERTKQLHSEVERLEEEVLEGRRHLVVLRNSLEEVEREQVDTEGRSRRLIAMLRDRTEELAEFEQETLAREEHVAALKADLESLEEEMKRLEAASHGREDQGDALRTFLGQGDRQYLTGLKVGGERIFILVDASASMLDQTVVNVVRRRHFPNEEKRRSEKWQRAVRTVDWLTTQIPGSSQFQIHTFDVASRPLLEGTEGTWLRASAPEPLERAVKNLQRVVPAGGTSLHHAFAALRAMEPAPDNIFLLTDGLPTQGASTPLRKTVSAEKRMDHFGDALEQLPFGTPINVILFPMEGDPDAAIAYWLLAQRSGGSFMSPSRDWP